MREARAAWRRRLTTSRSPSDDRLHGGRPRRPWGKIPSHGHDGSLRRRSPASRSTSSVFGKQNRIVEHPLRIPKDLARPGWPEAALECISRQSTSTPNARPTPESRRRGDTTTGEPRAGAETPRRKLVQRPGELHGPRRTWGLSESSALPPRTLSCTASSYPCPRGG